MSNLQLLTLTTSDFVITKSATLIILHATPRFQPSVIPNSPCNCTETLDGDF